MIFRENVHAPWFLFVYDNCLRRELMMRRKEGSRKKMNWNIGDACRYLDVSDGMEYEGSIVQITAR